MGTSVIGEGAYADILIVDGNPLEDIMAIGANDKWFDAKPRGQDVPPIRQDRECLGRGLRSVVGVFHEKRLSQP